MKPRISCMAALLTVASTGIAMGFGCSYETTRIEPVREVIIQQPSTYVMESRTTLDWGAPFRAVGGIVSAPFVALGSAFSPSERYVEPVGERFTTVRIIRHRTMLEPVGERFVTVKRYHKTLLMPVGERLITVKRYHKATLRPVGEKFIIWKHHQKAMLKPVGEKTSIQKTSLKWSPKKGTM